MKIYLIRGGRKKTGYFLLPTYFNYRYRAVAYLKMLNEAKNTAHLKIIRFEPAPESNPND